MYKVSRSHNRMKMVTEAEFIYP